MRRKSAIFFFICVLTWSSYLLKKSGAKEQNSAWNCLLITLDTVRADRLGCYGFPEAISPNIDRVSKSSLLFPLAYSAAPNTHPSIASILTGLLPIHHGSVKGNRPLDAQNITLAEKLSTVGYQTEAVVHNAWLSPLLGFDQGFTKYHFLDDHLTSPANRTVVWDAVSKLKGNGKRFLWLHFLDAHYPYRYHAEYVKRYVSNYRGKYTDSFTIDDINAHKLPNAPLNPEDLQYAGRLYEGEIWFLDKYLGTLFGKLKKQGISENTLVVLTADHGEEFKEHGGMGHEHTLFNELLHVPLLVAVPGLQKGCLKRSMIHLCDLFPTILELLEVPNNSPGDGTSFAPYVRSQENHRKHTEKSLISTKHFIYPGHHLLSLQQGRWKLIAAVSYYGARTAYESPTPFRYKGLSIVDSSAKAGIHHSQTTNENNTATPSGYSLKWLPDALAINLYWTLPKGKEQHWEVTFCLGTHTWKHSVKLPHTSKREEKPIAVAQFTTPLPPATGNGVLTINISHKEHETNVPVWSKVFHFSPQAGLLQQWCPQCLGTTVQLFDVYADPGELQDLSRIHPEIVKQMRSQINQLLKKPLPCNATRENVELHKELISSLKALGYVY